MAEQSNLRMELLEELAFTVDPGEFENIVVIHINHCMDNSFYFNDILNNIFAKTVFIGVPYNNKTVDVKADYIYYTASTEDENYKIYRNNELVEDASVANSPRVDLIWLTRYLIEQAIVNEALPEIRAGKKLIIIEDGGEHFKTILQLQQKYPELQEGFIGSVEQTTSGTVKYLKEINSEGPIHPCASVSRSRVKMSLESVFIGQRIVEELNRFLYSANNFLNYQDVIVVGYGVVGRSTAISLRGMAGHIKICDHTPLLQETARADGFESASAIKTDLLQRDTVIIGCTGTTVFDMDTLAEFMNSKAQNLYLASASSKSVEFSSFIEEADGVSNESDFTIEAVEKASYYCKYSIRDKSGSCKFIYLIADGVPVNFFDKNSISLTFRLIDIIFAEMLLLALLMCKERLESKLYLLGDDNVVSELINEKALLNRWFELNALNPEYISDESLRVHPNEDYLRGKLSKYGKE